MSINRNLQEVEMTLLIKSGETRTASGAVNETWVKVQDLTLKISTISIKRNVDKIRYIEYQHIGVTRELERISDGIYRLSDQKGLYEVLDVNKVGQRTIFTFRALEGDKNGGQRRV